MKKKFFAIAAVSLAMVMGLSGCTGVADLFQGKEEVNEEEVLENLVSMEDHRETILKDIEDLVELGQYKEVEVTITATQVTDEQIQSEIDTALANSGTVEQIKEGTVADGDTVNIDYIGTVDGVPFDGGTATAQDLEIGSGSYIEGFESGLVGAAIGSTVDINVTFPEDYGNETLNGKPAVFTVTINYKHGDPIAAELTDEWVVNQGLTDVATVDQYKEYVKSTLEEEAEATDTQLIYDAVMEKILADSKIKGISEDLNKEELIEQQLASFEETAAYYEMSVEDMIQQYMGMSMEEYEETLDKEVDLYFQNMMIVRAIMNAEDIQVEQADYEEAVLSYSPNYSYYGEESEASFVKNNSGAILDELLIAKVNELLLDTAVVTKQ